MTAMKPIPEHLKSKVEELKRSLPQLPMEKHKEVLEKGLELARVRQELKALKQEREELLKVLDCQQRKTPAIESGARLKLPLAHLILLALNPLGLPESAKQATYSAV